MIHNKLNKIFHQPIRGAIISHLIARGEADYNTLKSILNLTDGHLSTHMKALISSDYVEMEKKFINNKPNTAYFVTKKGREEFMKYVEDLKSYLLLHQNS